MEIKVGVLMAIRRGSQNRGLGGFRLVEADRVLPSASCSCPVDMFLNVLLVS